MTMSMEEKFELGALARELLATRVWVYDLKHSESVRDQKRKRMNRQTEQQAFEQFCIDDMRKVEMGTKTLPERDSATGKYQSMNGDWLVTLDEYRKEQWDYQRWHYAGSGMEELYLLQDGEYEFFPEEGYWENNREPIYVSRYEKSRVYGGPEEGGWYRSVTTHDAFLGPFKTFREAYAVLFHLKRIQDLVNENPFEPDWNALGGDETVSSTYPEGYTPSGWVCAKEHFYNVEPITGLYEYADSPHYE